jgi:salicylate biosynthesis isochorismate synthase/menaquinone-specific isochorismate synthase
VGHRADEPQVVKMANIQHLATPIRAQLADRVPAWSSRAACTRPPRSAASRGASPSRSSPRSRGLDRGWYAGSRGLDGPQRGRRVLRRAALRPPRGPRRPLLRGVGVVRDSDPAEELPRRRRSSRRCCPSSRSRAPSATRRRPLRPSRSGT